MIMLLGFKNYDEADAEYQVTGKDARHLAALVGHPGAVKVTIAYVTFLHEALTDESCNENSQEGGADSQAGLEQLNLK